MSTQIIIPVSKSYLVTFISNFLSIQYLNDQTLNLNSLKTQIFPDDYSDEEFNSLLEFVSAISNGLIKSGILIKDLKLSLRQKFNFVDEQFDAIVDTIIRKRVEIISKINEDLYGDKDCLYKGCNWSVKTILSGSNESSYPERFCDLELYLKGIKNPQIKHINITMSKQDVNVLTKSFLEIKSNLAKIKEAIK